MTDKTISLQEIAAFTNNGDLDPEILAFDTFCPPPDLSRTPLRIDSLFMLICNKGSGKISIDMQEYDIAPDTLITINPHNYLSFHDFTPDIACTMVVCSIRVVEEILPKLTDLLPIIIRNRQQPVRLLSGAEASRMRSFFAFIKSTIDGEETVFRKQKLMCLLQACLYEIMDISCGQNPGKISSSSRKEEILAKFILSVGEHFTRHRQVGFYADKLCITSKHLSAVVKETSGRTAGEWIENYVILEARMLLKNTDMTVQEIASRLNFANQSFFGKYFKHLTGLSPTEFRATRR